MMPARAEAVKQDIETTRIVDGDTIELKNGDHIRLWGIDTPERGQFGYWAAGAVLESILKSSPVLQCQKIDTDKYRRAIMHCFANGYDLGTLLVMSGWAKDFKKYSGGFYAQSEAEAKAQKRGLWANR